MAPTMKSLGIDRLSVDERLNLIGEIWDSINAEGRKPSLSEAQQQELLRRLQYHDENPDDGIP